MLFPNLVWHRLHVNSCPSRLLKRQQRERTCKRVCNQYSSFAMSFDSGFSLDSLLANLMPDHLRILSLEQLPFRVTSIKHLYKLSSSPTFSPSNQPYSTQSPLRPRQYDPFLLHFVGEQQTVTVHSWSLAKPAGYIITSHLSTLQNHLLSFYPRRRCGAYLSAARYC